MRPPRFLTVISIVATVTSLTAGLPVSGATESCSSSSSENTKHPIARELRRLKRLEWQARAEGKRSSDASTVTKRSGQFTYAPYSSDKVGNGQKALLFFYGLWSIPARANDATLKKWASGSGFIIPAYKVEYDTEKQLRKKYGVTYINSFVLVDGKGTKVQLLKSPHEAALSFILYGR
ncbi:MAG: hypothetical protein WCS85_00050 [Candidatus Peribacteraceae bacterium]|jgi:hypothetical protein